MPPGRYGLPWLGETLPFVRDPQRFHDARVRRYGPVFKTHLMGKPTVSVSGYDACLFVLTDGMSHLNWADGWPQTFRALLGRSLFVQDGEEHRQKRRLLMAAFNGPALASYVPRMEARVLEHLVRWQAEGELTLLPRIKQLTFEIASDLMLGTDPGADTGPLARAFAALTGGFFTAPLRLPLTPYARALEARETLLAHVGRAVHARRKCPSQDALSHLVHGVDEEGRSLTQRELEDQALLLLFAGHDTTTSFLLSTVRALALHPEALSKAQREQDALDIRGALTPDHLQRMTYLGQVLMEVERMYPPVPGGFRGVAESFELAGHTIPKGFRLSYRVHEAHRDPSVFREPERFDPDRFGPARAEHKKRRVALLGFGGGPRVCLGMAFAKTEMKIVLSHLLRKSAWQLAPRQDLSDALVPMRAPRSGLRVRISAR